jgi:hypothetical protein
MGSDSASAKVLVSVRASASDSGSVRARVRMASVRASVRETPLSPVAYS